MPNAPDLVLVVLDTARADDVMQRPLPALRALAERGTAFTTAISPAPWTLPAHASLFSGLLPIDHGITGDLALRGGHLHPVDRRIAELSDRWVPTALQAAGFQTFGASANPWITETMGFAAGFDTFISTGPAVGNVRFGASQRASWVPGPIRTVLAEGRRSVRALRPTGDSGAAASLDAFRSWWPARDLSRPSFAFFNFMEAHLPYTPPAKHAPRSPGRRLKGARLLRRLTNEFTLRYNVGAESLTDDELSLLRELYRGELAVLDDRLGELIALVGDRATIVVVGDHGENIGDHHLLGHQTSVADTLLHVPLVVTGAEVGVRAEPVSTAAVAGTILAQAGIPAGPTVFDDTDVRSFYESAYVEAAGARALADGPMANDAEAMRILTTRAAAVRRGTQKFVVRSDGSRSLFDLGADPGEAHDLLHADPSLADAFSGVELPLDPPTFDEELPQGQLDEIEARLESLGYL